jgi:hypothetical protein
MRASARVDVVAGSWIVRGGIALGFANVSVSAVTVSLTAGVRCDFGLPRGLNPLKPPKVTVRDGAVVVRLGRRVEGVLLRFLYVFRSVDFFLVVLPSGLKPGGSVALLLFACATVLCPETLDWSAEQRHVIQTQSNTQVNPAPTDIRVRRTFSPQATARLTPVFPLESARSL